MGKGARVVMALGALVACALASGCEPEPDFLLPVGLRPDLDAGTPSPDAPETPDDASEVPDADDAPDTEVPDAEVPDADAPDAPEPAPLPDALTVRLVNADPDDRVTRRKVFVVEFEPDPEAPTPESWAAQARWSHRFPATVRTVGADGRQVPLRQRWEDHQGGRRRFRPALIVEPATADGWPEGAGLVLEVRTGPGRAVTVPFRTLPASFDRFKEVELTLPARDCPQCFPYPVRVTVFLPPGYLDPTRPEHHNPAPVGPGDAGGSLAQRYPVTVLLHDAGAQPGYLPVARAAAPQIAAGLAEPFILALPDGRLDPDTCAAEPDVRAQGCHTRFLGLWRADNTILSYTTFLAEDLRLALRQRFRVRGADDQGEVTDPELYRRSHSLSGVSAGGYGALINALHHPEAWYASSAVIAGVVSAFNPFAHFGQGLRPREEVCPGFLTDGYPRLRVGQGFRDLSGVDPDTGARRQIAWRDRHIPPGAANCFQPVPAISGQLVRAGLCQLDVACMVDPEAPDYSALDELRGPSPFHGNLAFDTGIFDGGGPLAAFVDLDELLDRAEIDHSFHIEDRGGLTHGGISVRDRYHGDPWLQHAAGQCRLPATPGNGPRVYPWLSRAMQGHAAPAFNSLRSSTFSVTALDADRDGALDFDHPDFPDLRDAPDNCPGRYNPDQDDRDGDGLGDACDPDLDGDGIDDRDDPCLVPDLGLPDGPGCDRDRDGDLVPDDDDRCPAAFDPHQRDLDGDGLGDACDDDDDGDGVLDDDDRCPRVHDPEQADFDDDGAGDACAPAGVFEDVAAWCASPD